MKKGDTLVVRRFVSLALSLCVVMALGIARVDQLLAQEAKKTAPAPAAAPAAPTAPAAKAEVEKKETPKTETPKKEEAAKPAEEPLKPIPPAVQAKLEAARKAVAEAIVAAQDAGLVETSIDPPPILDILITGRAIDARTLKNATAKKPYSVSPEVFGAWFTGYGKVEGIDYVKDVRIINPSAGLKTWYDQRASSLGHYIDEARKAKGPAPAAAAAPAPAPAAAPVAAPAAPAAKAEEVKKK
jgi:hypothetical protein